MAVINKTAFFSVHIARTLCSKSPEERKQVLASINPQSAAVVREALKVLLANK